MKHTEYGDKQGYLTIYFHGAPGGTKEPAIFDDLAQRHGLRLVCIDRFSIPDDMNQNDYIHELAAHIKSLSNGKPLSFLGFSIGAFTALEVSRLLQDQINQVHLISAAAPLPTRSATQRSKYTKEMAGGLVFDLAIEKPLLFHLLTKFQQFLATLSPQLLTKLIFSSATGKDKSLFSKADFKDYITDVISNCFKRSIGGYMREIKLYTQWDPEPNRYHSNTVLWHGMVDNWAPANMVPALIDTIAGPKQCHNLSEMSHYSCLIESAPKIFEQLGKGTK